MENAPSAFAKFSNFLAETFATTEMVYVAIFCVAYLIIYNRYLKHLKTS
jgi:hypothetical protein